VTAMTTPEEYLERAAKCEKLAAEAVTERDRKVMLDVAKRWRDIAAEEMSSSADELQY
jgi:hypothetical protein